MVTLAVTDGFTVTIALPDLSPTAEVLQFASVIEEIVNVFVEAGLTFKV
jgi:hypothetical protein